MFGTHAAIHTARRHRMRHAFVVHAKMSWTDGSNSPRAFARQGTFFERGMPILLNFKVPEKKC